MLPDIYGANNTMLAGSTINSIIIYGGGEVLAEVHGLERHEVDNSGVFSAVYGDDINKVFLNSEIRKANKINLARKDIFYSKNPERQYSFDPAYNLYIYVEEVIFEDCGDLLASKLEHEENYLHAYKIGFPKVEIRRHQIDRYICDPDTYKLQPGETFSDMCYGPDASHPCINSFKIEDTAWARKRHPERIGEAGVIKKYFVTVEEINAPYMYHKRYYSKIIYDDYRMELERLSDDLEKVNIKLSFYDLDKICQAGYVITKK